MPFADRGSSRAAHVVLPLLLLAPTLGSAAELGPTNYPAQQPGLSQQPDVFVDDADVASGPDAPGYHEFQDPARSGSPLFFWPGSDAPCSATGDMRGTSRFTYERGGVDPSICTPPSLDQDVNWATWRPTLPCAGTYRISAWIPPCGGPLQITNAVYKVYTSQSSSPVSTRTVDQRQEAQSPSWIQLATTSLAQDGGDYVRLGDVPQTPPPYCDRTVFNRRIVYDSMKFEYVGPTAPSPEQRKVEVVQGLQACTDTMADPVTPSTGNFLHQVLDLRIPFRGPVGLEMERTYNSRNHRIGLFGFGWSSILDMQLRLFADGSADVWMPDGSTRSWSGSGGIYTAFPGVFDRLVRTASGWEMTTPQQVTYFFDDIYQGGWVGRLRRIEDRHANGVTFAYDSSGMPAIVSDDAGRRIVFTHADGHVTAMTDPLGRTWVYGYDGDLLTSSTDAMAGVTRYAHDTSGFIAEITDAAGVLYIRNVYDADGRVLEQSDALGNVSTFSYGPNSTTLVDVLGRTTVYSHDAQLRRSGRLDAMGYTQSWEHPANTEMTRYTDRRGNTWIQSYDGRGNMTSSRCPTGCTRSLTYNATNDPLTERNALGYQTTFTWAGGNEVAIDYPDGGHVSFTHDPFGQVVSRTDQNGHVRAFTYDVYGDRIRQTDALGNMTSQEFDIVGRRTAVTDANGHRTEFLYDANDNILEVTDPKGASVVMEYDADDLLRRLIDRRGAERTYEYDVNLRLVREIDPEGHVVAHEYDAAQRRVATIDGRHARTTFRYDALDRIVETEDALGGTTSLTLDPNGNVVLTRDPEGHSTSTDYDERNFPTRVVDALGGERRTEYDSIGRVTRTIDERGAETRLVYDPMDRLLTSTDALGNVTATSHDLVGNVLTVANARGAVHRFDYDAADRVVRETDPGGHVVQSQLDPVGNVLVRRNARGFETRMQYDANDNLERITDALSGVVRFEHDAENERTAVVDQRGYRTEFAYDGDGLLREVIEPGDLRTSMDYDGDHDVIHIRNAKGNATVMERDALGHVVLVTDPMGDESASSFDRDGLLISRRDANEHETRYAYDPLHRLERVTDALGHDTSYAYEAGGSLTTILNASGATTSFDHDVLGRVVGETNAVGGTWSYVRDAVGNVIRMTDANGRATKYEYDLDDLLIAKTYARDPVVRFRYDENHDLVEVRDGLGRIQQAFDALDRLTTSTNHVGQTVQYRYDAEGNRTSFRFPDGREMQYVIDANDRVESIRDPEGGIFRATWDRTHHLTSLSSPNATVATLGYDEADRLTSLSNRRTSGAILSAFSFVLDGVGNRTRIVEQHVDRTGSVQHDYQYDAIDRLVFSQDSLGRFTGYEYDPVGNRTRLASNYDPYRTPTSVSPYTVTYEHDAADRLLRSVHSVLGVTTYQNDANGNRTRQEGPGEFSGAGGQSIRRDYQYDDENRLAQVEDKQQLRGSWSTRGTSTMSYDGLGRLFRRQRDERVGGGGTKWSDFAYDGLDPILESVKPGTRSYTYQRGFGGLLSSREFPGSGTGLTSYYHRDGLGSTSVVTNQLGQSAHVYRYADYGTILDVNGGVADSSAFTNPHNSFCYTGQEFVEPARLSHFFAREHDSVAGRWLQEDLLRGNRQRPASLCRVAYVEDNPLTWQDMRGFERGASLFGPWSSLDYIEAGNAALEHLLTPLILRPRGYETNFYQYRFDKYAKRWHLEGVGLGADIISSLIDPAVRFYYGELDVRPGNPITDAEARVDWASVALSVTLNFANERITGAPRAILKFAPGGTAALEQIPILAQLERGVTETDVRQTLEDLHDDWRRVFADSWRALVTGAYYKSEDQLFSEYLQASRSH